MLDRISIAAPCTADWDSMPGSDRVRHCAECNKNVYNLSEMTRREAEALLREKEGQLCARRYRRADGTILTSNCPAGLRAIGRGISRVAGAAMSAMMTFSSASAQIPFFQIPSAQQQESSASVTGTVQSIVKDGLSDALVELTRNGSGEKLAVHTDEHGRFLVQGLNPGAYTFRIHSPGFADYSKQIALGSRQDLKITATMDLGLLMGAIVPEVVPVTVEIAHRQLTAQ
jgi:hypothetical protein